MSVLPSYLDLKDKHGKSKFLQNIDELYLTPRLRTKNTAVFKTTNSVCPRMSVILQSKVPSILLLSVPCLLISQNIPLYSQRIIYAVSSRLFPSTTKSHFTYLLTPWSGFLLQKLIGLQIIKKFPAFYETTSFITTCLYSEPAPSSPYPHIQLPEDPS